MAGAIELLGAHDDDSFSTLLDDALGTFCTNATEQLTEPRFRLVQLPNPWFVHANRLGGLVQPVKLARHR